MLSNQSKGNNSKTEEGRVTAACNYCKRLQETYIPSLESFKHMVTMLRPGQEMFYKIQRRLNKRTAL